MRAPIADFKTLGAKRYLVETEKGKVKMTVAGVNPAKGAAYLVKKYGKKSAFDAFDIDLTIPAAATGKLTHTYIDEEIEGDIYDYDGRLGHFHDLSFIHLSPCEYNMSMSGDFLEFLKGVRTDYEV